MKVRHAAALALAGWYLMLPPMNEKGVATEASISDWDQVGSFDSAAACAQASQEGRSAVEGTNDQNFKELSERDAAQNGKERGSCGISRTTLTRVRIYLSTCRCATRAGGYAQATHPSSDGSTTELGKTSHESLGDTGRNKAAANESSSRRRARACGLVFDDSAGVRGT